MTGVHAGRPEAGQIAIETTADAAARLAAERAAEIIVRGQSDGGSVRVIFASAPSQEQMLEHLSREERIDWTRVTSFHMDEYLDLPMTHPQAFGRWLADRLPEAAQAGLSRIRTDADVDAELARYTDLITAAPIDLVCLGVGVNGHIAFNEPGDARSDDPQPMRAIELDPVSRQQQVDDGLFTTMAEVPARALTLTVPTLLSGSHLVCTVLGTGKAAAVAAALTGPVTDDCPASTLQRHPDVRWFLDDAAASELPRS